MAREKILCIVAVLCALILGTATATNARIIYVDDDAPAGGDGASWPTAYRFLQEALVVAKVAEKPIEVRVAGGLYKPDEHEWAPDGTGDRKIWFESGNGVSLIGGYAGLAASDPNLWDPETYETILSGDLAGNDAEVIDPTLLREDPTRDDNTDYAVLVIANGKSILSGCSITGGTAGGVLLSRNPDNAINNITISDCKFYGNRGSEYSPVSAGALTAWLWGVDSPINVLVQRCSFVENTGDTGAVSGIFLVLEQCQFLRNYAWGEGPGAVSLSQTGRVTDCVFMENSCKRWGGALYLSSTHPVGQVTRCVFRDNSSGSEGGAVILEGDVRVYGCLFVGNRARTLGGGIVHSQGDGEIVNSVFVGNDALETGGACFAGWASLLEITNCTSAANRSNAGTFLGFDCSDADVPNGAVLSNCILYDGANEIWSNEVRIEMMYSCLTDSTNPNDWVVYGPGILATEPCFVDPGYWDDNGTADDPNDDFFVEGDYHLKSQAGRWDPASGSWVQDDVTSPCIDAGDPNTPIMYEPFPNGGIINMGAYAGTTEASKSYFGQPACETIIAGDINGDCKVDMLDLVLLISHWTDP